MTRYPFAEVVANRVKVSDCVARCKDTQELYGYTKFVFSAERARKAFCLMYAEYRQNEHQQDQIPGRWETEAGLAIIEERVERVVSL
jgi:hypothetical protein